MVQRLQIDSLRAEITLFEAARAYAAIDARSIVTVADLREVASMALRMRRSPFMAEYFTHQDVEEHELNEVIEGIVSLEKS
jgi:magnesium chelatase subunit I